MRKGCRELGTKAPHSVYNTLFAISKTLAINNIKFYSLNKFQVDNSIWNNVEVNTLHWLYNKDDQMMITLLSKHVVNQVQNIISVN